MFGSQISYTFARARISLEVGIQHAKKLCRLESSHLYITWTVKMFSKGVNRKDTGVLQPT